MKEPVWIDPDVVLQFHDEQLAEHGGQAGVRDQGLFESAMHRPLHLWSYTVPKPDLPALAASVAYGLSRNHPFLDGNKRTAWVACRTFLRLNGCDVKPTQIEIVESVLTLAAGHMSEERFAEWLRTKLVALP